MLPEKVTVGGIEYTTNEIFALEQKHGLMGQVLYSTTEIEVDDRLSEDRKEQIFVHEMLHACFYEAGFNEQDEDVVNRVSAVLHQVLKDNDFSWLREKNTMVTTTSIANNIDVKEVAKQLHQEMKRGISRSSC